MLLEKHIFTYSGSASSTQAWAQRTDGSCGTVAFDVERIAKNDVCVLQVSYQNRKISKHPTYINLRPTYNNLQ